MKGIVGDVGDVNEAFGNIKKKNYTSSLNQLHREFRLLVSWACRYWENSHTEVVNFEKKRKMKLQATEERDCGACTGVFFIISQSALVDSIQFYV